MLRAFIVVLVLSASFASAEDAVVVRYAGGAAGALDAAGANFGGACVGTEGAPLHGGGACGIAVKEGAYVVTVVDALAGPLGFTWAASDATGAQCGTGSGVSGDTIVVCEGCASLHVFLPAGATTGEITIARV